MGTQEYLMATGYTVADAYLYTILNWAKYLKVDLSRWPKLLAHHNRIRARPATTATWKAESLQSESKV
jgi:glutathione S-transferase